MRRSVGDRVRGERGTRSLALRAAIALSCAVFPGPGLGAEFERLDATEESGIYRVDASLTVDAPQDAVLKALLDFEGQKALGPPIREIRVVGTQPDGATIVEIVTEICIGIFCPTVKQLQLVRFVPPGLVTATSIRDKGDVRSGRVDVQVTAEGGRTRIRIECVVQPARKRPFFVPKGWVLGALRRQARESAAGLERLAVRIAARSAPARVD